MTRIAAVQCLLMLVFAIVGAASPPAASIAGDRALGQHLSSECVTCHQLSGRFEGIPPIVGWPEESFVEIMNEYRERKRPNPVMQTIAGRLSGDEVAALAAYFGSLKATQDQRKTKGGKS